MRGPFAAILFALGFVCAAVFGFVPRTASGVQCPTAPVQTVQVAVRDCCERIVGYEVRAPKPGEQAFVQCRCAEKKGATQHAVVSSGKIELIAPARFEFDLPEPLPLSWAAHRYTESPTTWLSAPPTPPPAVS